MKSCTVEHLNFTG